MHSTRLTDVPALWMMQEDWTMVAFQEEIHLAAGATTAAAAVEHLSPMANSSGKHRTWNLAADLGSVNVTAALHIR